MSLSYRPEVDGLRAIAVGVVLLYHAHFPFTAANPVPGGFVGVDVFFVISGYLITLILLRERDSGSFSYASFYERRARRLLPALFAVLIVSCFLAWKWLLPKALVEFAGSLASALLFGSNIWFLLEDSYIAEASALKPLLHTWSLAVEEQFYLLFPLILFALMRLDRKWLVPSLSVLSLLSLHFAHSLSGINLDAAFYLLPTRGWELAIGSILACVERTRPRPIPSVYTDLLSGLGILFILAATFAFYDGMRHPSYVTVLPVAGTAMLLWYSSSKGLSGKILASDSFVGMGKISYSLYLWHFPVLAFARLNSQEQLSSGYLASLLLLSLVLAIASYHLVEKPFRHGKSVSLKVFIPLLMVLLCGFLTLAALWSVNDGYVKRFGPVAELLGTARPERLAQNGAPCSGRELGAFCEFNHEPQSSQARDSNRLLTDFSSIIAVGDSHAESLAGSLNRVAQRYGKRFLQMTKTGCPLISQTLRRIGDAIDADCERSTKDINQALLEIDPSVIVYAIRLPHNVNPVITANGTLRSRLVLNKGLDNSYSVTGQLHKMIAQWLDVGHTVVLVYPIPKPTTHVPKAIQNAVADVPKGEQLEQLNSLKLGSTLEEHRAYTQLAREMYDSVAPHRNLLRVDPTTLFCTNADQQCRTFNREFLYYYDRQHLAPTGAEMVVEEIVKQLTVD